MSENPFVKPITDAVLVNPDPKMAVILDRIEPGKTPPCCVHGKTTCWKCDEWCWLGSETYEVVRSGKATPLCMQCTEVIYKEHPEAFNKPVDHLDDHRA